MSKLKIYSGQCLMGDVGQPTGKTDMNGEELFVGDVVQLWHGNYIGEEFAEWLPSDGLTAIVSNKYQPYSDGTHKVINDNPKPFTMGISSIGVKGDDWDVKLVKSHKEIVSGERIKSFGFRWVDGEDQ